jgi:hypothetical protein
MTVRNTLAYYTAELITKVKSFIVHAPGLLGIVKINFSMNLRLFGVIFCGKKGYTYDETKKINFNSKISFFKTEKRF